MCLKKGYVGHREEGQVEVMRERQGFVAGMDWLLAAG